MTLSRRSTIRICAFVVSALGVLIVRNFQLMSQNDKNIRKINSAYSRALESLAMSCENISDNLEKQLYASSPELHRSLAEKIYLETSDAKSQLSQLPAETVSLENTYKFLSQAGNYSLALCKKLNSEKTLTDEEYKNKLLEKLQEEICEFITDKNEEELADILEVIEHIITAFNFNKKRILEIREKKQKRMGNLIKK